VEFRSSERLQIILSHERATGGQSDLAILREEILSAVAKHVSIDRDSIQVRLNRSETVSALEINVEIPCLVDSRSHGPEMAYSGG
jgi:cell division topological specificity factor